MLDGTQMNQVATITPNHNNPKQISVNKPLVLLFRTFRQLKKKKKSLSIAESSQGKMGYLDISGFQRLLRKVSGVLSLRYKLKNSFSKLFLNTQMCLFSTQTSTTGLHQDFQNSFELSKYCYKWWILVAAVQTTLSCYRSSVCIQSTFKI